MNKILAFSIVVTLLTLTTSCKHKDLFYGQDIEHSVSVGVDVDWSKYNATLPDKMSLLVYSEREDLLNEEVSSNIEHAKLLVPIGKPRIAVINKEIKDFNTILFKDINDFKRAEAVAKGIDNSWYNEFSVKGEKIAEQPEWFGYDYKDVSITGNEKDTVIATLYPTCKVYTVNVKVKVKDIHKIKSVRGAITGFSEGFSFSLNDTNEGLVSHLLDGWKMKLDYKNPNDGVLTCSFQTFGFPRGHKSLPEDNKLRIFLTFKADDPQEYPLDVGDLFEQDDTDDNIWHLEVPDPIDLSEIDMDEDDTGGFDVDIDGWEESTTSDK